MHRPPFTREETMKRRAFLAVGGQTAFALAGSIARPDWLRAPEHVASRDWYTNARRKHEK
jgi:hypothetical protein